MFRPQYFQSTEVVEVCVWRTVAVVMMVVCVCVGGGGGGGGGLLISEWVHGCQSGFKLIRHDT